MRKLVTSIINIVLLLVTSLVLVLSLFAWYVSNREVSANGISASVLERDPLVETAKIYSFKSSVENQNSTTTYTIEHVYNAYSEEVVMEYNPNFDNTTPGLKLLELNFRAAVDIQQLYANSRASYFIGYPNSTNPGYIISGVNLSLSSLMNFGKLDANNVTVSGQNEDDTVIMPTNINKTMFDYNFATDNSIVSTNAPLINQTLTNITKLYIVLDYEEERVNRLFSNNIGNIVMDTILYSDDPNIKLTFGLDYNFMLIGEVRQS